MSNQNPIDLLLQELNNTESKLRKNLENSLTNVDSTDELVKVFEKLTLSGKDEDLIKLADKFKSKIQILTQKKDPISWLLGIKEIKDDLVEFIETVSDNINEQFSTFDSSVKMGILYDCGYSGINRDFKDYIDKKQTEDFWLYNRLNYRIKLKNDNEKLKSYQLLESYNQFRKIVLSLQDSYFSDVTKFFVYGVLTEKLNLSPDIYQNLKFVFLFVLPKNYSEYCKIYNFLFEYDKFKGFGLDKKQKFVNRIKISFFVIVLMLVTIICISLYLSLLLGIGIGLFLAGWYAKNINYYDMNSNIRWHLGTQTIGVIVMMVCGFIFLAQSGIIEFNLGSFSSKNIGKKVDNVVYYDVNDVIKSNNINFAEMTKFFRNK